MRALIVVLIGTFAAWGATIAGDDPSCAALAGYDAAARSLEYQGVSTDFRMAFEVCQVTHVEVGRRVERRPVTRQETRETEGTPYCPTDEYNITRCYERLIVTTYDVTEEVEFAIVERDWTFYLQASVTPSFGAYRAPAVPITFEVTVRSEGESVPTAAITDKAYRKLYALLKALSPAPAPRASAPPAPAATAATAATHPQWLEERLAIACSAAPADLAACDELAMVAAGNTRTYADRERPAAARRERCAADADLCIVEAAHAQDRGSSTGERAHFELATELLSKGCAAGARGCVALARVMLESPPGLWTGEPMWSAETIAAAQAAACAATGDALTLVAPYGRWPGCRVGVGPAIAFGEGALANGRACWVRRAKRVEGGKYDAALSCEGEGYLLARGVQLFPAAHERQHVLSLPPVPRGAAVVVIDVPEKAPEAQVAEWPMDEGWRCVALTELVWAAERVDPLHVGEIRCTDPAGRKLQLSEAVVFEAGVDLGADAEWERVDGSHVWVRSPWPEAMRMPALTHRIARTSIEVRYERWWAEAKQWFRSTNEKVKDLACDRVNGVDVCSGRVVGTGPTSRIVVVGTTPTRGGVLVTIDGSPEDVAARPDVIEGAKRGFRP